MLLGEKKKNDFLIENDLKAFPYSEAVKGLFSQQELLEFENVAEKVKARLKTINANLSSKEMKESNMTYDKMKDYYYTIMLEYYGEKLIERLTKAHDKAVGYDRERILDLLENQQKAYENAKIQGPEYREKITQTIEKIVSKKKGR